MLPRCETHGTKTMEHYLKVRRSLGLSLQLKALRVSDDLMRGLWLLDA